MSKPVRDLYISKVVNLQNSIKRITEYQKDPKQYNLLPAHVEGILSDIRTKIPVKQKNIIMNDIQQGLTTLAEVQGLPINAWCVPEKNGYRAVANLFSRIKHNGDTINYQVREVFGILVYANVMRTIANNPKTVYYNTTIVTNSLTIYVRMWMSLIDRMYAVSNNSAQASGVAFNIAKFFLKFLMYERDFGDDFVTSLCASVASKQTGVSDPRVVLEFANRIDQSVFNPDNLNLKSFCMALAEAFPLIKDLDVNVFLRFAISSFGEKSLYMIEQANSFIGYTVSSVYSANLIKDFTFENVSGKDGVKLATTILDMSK
ncbi:hypothetical protein [Proteus mirabilis]|uniref:hypothetical protein n=1 Tax=Proteus mirabilis TaxID=584 RepID=UPI0034D50E72